MPCLTRVPEINSIERLSDVESSTEPNKNKKQKITKSKQFEN